MTSKHIDGHTHPTKMTNPAPDTEDSLTVYVLMAICYVLIAITMYVIWQKASSG